MAEAPEGSRGDEGREEGRPRGPGSDGTRLRGGASHGTGVGKRSLTVAGHRTSISLEDAFWDGLRDVAAVRATTMAGLVAEIDRGRGPANLSSAIRVFVLDHFRASPSGGPAPSGGG